MKSPGVNTVRVHASVKEEKIRFTFSADMVEGLVKLYLRRKAAKLEGWMLPKLHARFTPLADRGMPAVFITLAPLLLDFYALPYCYRLIRVPNKHTFRFTVPAKYIGVRLDIKGKRLRTMWVKDPPGLMLIFDDEDMSTLYRADLEKSEAAE